MKPLSISILSDLHLDAHFKALQQTKEHVQAFFDPIFRPEGEESADVLVIAGDLGHYNSENLRIITHLKDLYFKHIVCVLGNHDYYLLHRLQQLDYGTNSFKRVREMREQLNAIDGIHCLDGNIVEIEGIRFGGCDSWYDGEFGKWLYDQNGTKGDWMQRLWTMSMNDARLIYGIKRFDEIWEMEKPKIEAVYQSCDVMITHVSPSINPEHIDQRYRNDKATGFFSFDGEEFVKNTTAKVWIYGHTHTPNDCEWHGVRLICNQLGYPGENMNVHEKRIELEVAKCDLRTGDKR